MYTISHVNLAGLTHFLRQSQFSFYLKKATIREQNLSKKFDNSKFEVVREGYVDVKLYLSICHISLSKILTTPNLKSKGEDAFRVNIF